MRTSVYSRPCLTAMARSPSTTIRRAARKPTSSPSSTGRLNSPAHGDTERTPRDRLRQPPHAPELLEMRARRHGNFDLRAAKRILLRLHEEYPELHLFPKPSIDILMGARAQ